MQRVKQDPDGADISDTGTSELRVCPQYCNNTNKDIEASIQAAVRDQCVKTSDPPVVIDERQQADKNCAPLFRPIAPKPRPNPGAHVHSVQTVLPTPVIVPRAPVDADGFISFGGYERYISHSNHGGAVPRLEYANTIVSYQNLHVPGETTLRLYQVVPKSRTSLIDPNANDIVKPLPSRRGRPAREPQPASTRVPSNVIGWNCLHQTSRSKLNTSTHTKTIPPGDQHATVRSDSLTGQDENFAKTGVILNVNRLRPSAELLTRIGRQLVESQYKQLTFDECGCGKVRHLETPTYGSEKSSESPDNVESGSDDDQLAVRESTHLEWRKKPEHPRWVRVRALCGTHQCPFIPSTMFQFHRHLEQGHQRMWRCNVRRRREPSSLNTELPADLTLPLIINPHVRSIQRVTCPVCPDFRNTVGVVVEHIDRAHPFISSSLSVKPPRQLCGICGTLTNALTTTCHIGSSGSYVHYSCHPNTKSVRYAAWANRDAHSLACLMLNPNRHSRLSLSESMVRQLYQSMDYVLSINSGRSRLWTIDSFTLRCTLAISSLFGELIHVPSTGDTPLLTRCELDETNNQSVPALSAVGLPEPKVIDEMSVSSSSSAANSPIQTKLMALETGTQLNSSSVIVHSEAVPISAALSVENRSGYAPKRLYNSQPSQKVTLERKSKVPRIGAGEEIYMHRPPKEFSSQQTIIVDLTNGDSSEAECNGSSLTIVGNSNHKVDNVDVSSLSPFIGSDKSGSSTLARIARVVQEVCELCNAFVRSCRQHLIEKHGYILGSVPTEFCLCCGRLFWTEEGCDTHQNLKCPVCSKDVCRTSVFLHLAEEHQDQLVGRLRGHPIICPSCPTMFIDLSRFLSHLRLTHYCLVPREVCDQLPMDRIPSILRGASLSDLRTLETYSKQSLRKRTAIPDCVPPNIVTYDKSVSNLPMYSCSVCASAFVSLIHLDLHTTLTGHQYWCALCPFACRRSPDLISHHSMYHQISAPKLATGVQTILPKPITPVAGAVLSPQLSAIFGQTQPTLTGQIHACDKCPVFCLTLEDLNLHRTTVHRCTPLARPQSTTMSSYPSPSTSANVAPTVIIASGTAPITSTLRQLRPTGVQRTRFLVPNAASGINTLMNIRQPLIVRSQNSLTSPSMNIRMHLPSAPVTSTTAAPVSPSMSEVEDLACPMCDFQSKNRAEVMQHIVDAH